jgi:nicotinamidase-related amidase
MQQIIFFVILALYVQSYFGLDFIQTQSHNIQSISSDDKLNKISCYHDCELLEFYFNFQEYYKDNPDILSELSTFALFKDYLLQEDDLDRINNVVNKYREKIDYDNSKNTDIFDNKLIKISCNDYCKLLESYFHFQEYYKDNPDILSELPTFSLFKDYLSKEGDLDRINNIVNKYAEKVGCYDISKDAIPGTAIIVINMQDAFMSNGPVEVNGAENAIEPINKAKKYHQYSIHSLDTYLPLWSLSFSTTPNYGHTFYPYARQGTTDFNEVDGLDTCVDLYIGKKDFHITSNPLFKEYILKNNITKLTFTGVAGDFSINVSLLAILDDSELFHVQISLYEPGVKWVHSYFNKFQKLNFVSYSNFRWINNEEELLYFLKN